MNTMPCQSCKENTLEWRSDYRWSAQAVVVGNVLLLASSIGLFLGVLGIFGLLTGVTLTPRNLDVEKQAKARMEQAHIPEATIANVLAGTLVDLQPFDEPQRLAVEYGLLWIRTEDLNVLAGALRFGLGCLLLMMISIIGGLTGRRLGMKQMILQCTNCRATFAPP